MQKSYANLPEKGYCRKGVSSIKEKRRPWQAAGTQPGEHAE